MGHKTSPTGFRIGITEDWRSRWFPRSKKDYPVLILEDYRIRTHIKKNYKDAGVSKIEIERYSDLIKVILHAARPASLVGRRGGRVNQLGEEITKMTGKRAEIDVKEILVLALDAQLVADSIAAELERRMPHKRIMHKYSEQVMAENARGVKIQCQGRLGGAEIARTDHILVGKIPLQSLRAVIDYAQSTAHLTKGTIGIKVWIYKGDLIEDKKTREKKII